MSYGRRKSGLSPDMQSDILAQYTSPNPASSQSRDHNDNPILNAIWRAFMANCTYMSMSAVAVLVKLMNNGLSLSPLLSLGAVMIAASTTYFIYKKSIHAVYLSLTFIITSYASDLLHLYYNAEGQSVLLCIKAVILAILVTNIMPAIDALKRYYEETIDKDKLTGTLENYLNFTLVIGYCGVMMNLINLLLIVGIQ